MVRKSRWKEKLYLATYDKPGLNRRALSVKKSLDEIEKILLSKEKEKKKS